MIGLLEHSQRAREVIDKLKTLKDSTTNHNVQNLFGSYFKYGRQNISHLWDNWRFAQLQDIYVIKRIIIHVIGKSILLWWLGKEAHSFRDT